MVTPERLAVIVTEVAELTALVLTVKPTDVPPAGIKSVAGTEAKLELLDMETFMPRSGAGPLNVTFPVLSLPPFTEDKFNLIETSAGE